MSYKIVDEIILFIFVNYNVESLIKVSQLEEKKYESVYNCFLYMMF